MRSRFAVAIGASVILLSSAAVLRADSVTDQIDEAVRLYNDNDIAGAITELEFALQELRGKIGEQYLATLPDAPEGWEAQEPEQQSGGAFMGGGTMITRQYQKQDGEGSIEAQLIVNNPMIQGFAAMLANPALLASQPNTQRVRIGRENAILQWDPDNRSGELTLVMGSVMIQLSGHGLETSDPMVELLKAWDLKAVKELAGA